MDCGSLDTETWQGSVLSDSYICTLVQLLHSFLRCVFCFLHSTRLSKNDKRAIISEGRSSSIP
jgi:hypothetical protein